MFRAGIKKNNNNKIAWFCPFSPLLLFYSMVLHYIILCDTKGSNTAVLCSSILGGLVLLPLTTTSLVSGSKSTENDIGE